MGMPVTLEVIDASATEALFETVFSYFQHVDEKFSTYKENSEISQINNHSLDLQQASEEMKTVFELAEQTRLEPTDILISSTKVSLIPRAW